QECQRVRDRSRRAGGGRPARARAGSSGHRRGLPDPELLWARHSPRPTSRDPHGSAATPAEDHAHAMNEPALHAIAAGHVFDGTRVRERAAVIVDGARIADLVPTTELPRDIATHLLPAGAWLAPGFIDLQVNGGGDVLFNDQPNAQGIRAIAAAHRRFG